MRPLRANLQHDHNTKERWTAYDETPHAPESVHPQSRPSRGGLAAPRGVAVIVVRYSLLPGAGAARGSGAVRCDILADQLALGEDIAHGPRTALEPLTVLAALAVSTSRIGLIATASTTYTEPFNLARQFASLDHISRGRIGWNIVTSWLAPAARNYGGTAQMSHAERYTRAEEFMTVVKGLWDSWAADAELDDRASGRYANPARIRPLNHTGAYY